MEERNGKILLRFLHSILEQDPKKTQLFLLGDIFDLWVGNHRVFVKSYRPLIDAFKKLREHGVRIIYFEGNHDVHIENFFQYELGFEVFVTARYFEVDGVTIRCEHGDLINLNDTAYLKYRNLIRGAFVRFLALHLPGQFWDFVGKKMSQASRKKSAIYRVENEGQLIEMIRAHSARAFLEKPFDLILSGHMHVFDDYTCELGNKNVRTINLGSWFENEVRVFLLKDGKGEWITLPQG